MKGEREGGKVRGKDGYSMPLENVRRKQGAYYEDINGHKIDDKGTIAVAEWYMGQGFNVIFQPEQSGERGVKGFDLTLRTSENKEFIRDIEVKRITSVTEENVTKHIKEGFQQVQDGGTVTIYLPRNRQDQRIIRKLQHGFEEANRLGLVKGHVEAFFSDGSRMELKLEKKKTKKRGRKRK